MTTSERDSRNVPEAIAYLKNGSFTTFDTKDTKKIDRLCILCVLCAFVVNQIFRKLGGDRASSDRFRESAPPIRRSQAEPRNEVKRF
jgi:hypothetical protein